MRFHQSRPWVLAATSVLLLGVVGSLLGARAVAADEADTWNHRFESDASRAAASIDLELRREADLLADITARFAEFPGMTSGNLERWAERAGVFERHPELVGMTVIVVVKPGDLAEHTARVLGDPVDAAKGPFTLIPGGPRLLYCLAQANVSSVPTPLGYDYCSDPSSDRLRPLMDDAVTQYIPARWNGEDLLGISVPTYIGGAVPDTVAERRRLFGAMVAVAVRPQAILARARAASRQDRVSIVYRDDISTVRFGSGPRLEHSKTTTRAVGTGWQFTATRRQPAGGVTDSGAALALLVGGTLTSLLLALVIAILATSRARALQLVASATAELRHQALHDALTGLANRTLLADRLDHLLARARRDDSVPAAIFLDVDGFKQVNDSLGHDAGDRLLREIADRLRGAVRDADTIARMGGDEFVVLVDSATSIEDPVRLAERMLDALRRPFDLGEPGTAVTVSASLGIAIGARASGDDLLRDADMALYRSKAAGKDRYTTFEEGMEPGGKGAVGDRRRQAPKLGGVQIPTVPG